MLETPNLVHTLGGSIQAFLGIFFLVRLELVPAQNGLTLNWTFTYSRTISALGLVFFNSHFSPVEGQSGLQILKSQIKVLSDSDCPAGQQGR